MGGVVKVAVGDDDSDRDDRESESCETKKTLGRADNIDATDDASMLSAADDDSAIGDEEARQYIT